MKEQQITVGTARLAQSKGFDIIANSYPLKSFQIGEDSTLTGHTLPTQVSLQKWLREKHNLFVSSQPYTGADDKSLFYSAGLISIYPNDKWYETERTQFDKKENRHFTYELALEYGFEKALNLI